MEKNRLIDVSESYFFPTDATNFTYNGVHTDYIDVLYDILTDNNFSLAHSIYDNPKMLDPKTKLWINVQQ